MVKLLFEKEIRWCLTDPISFKPGCLPEKPNWKYEMEWTLEGTRSIHDFFRKKHENNFSKHPSICSHNSLLNLLLDLWPLQVIILTQLLRINSSPYWSFISELAVLLASFSKISRELFIQFWFKIYWYFFWVYILEQVVKMVQTVCWKVPFCDFKNNYPGCSWGGTYISSWISSSRSWKHFQKVP